MSFLPRTGYPGREGRFAGGTGTLRCSHWTALGELRRMPVRSYFCGLLTWAAVEKEWNIDGEGKAPCQHEPTVELVITVVRMLADDGGRRGRGGASSRTPAALPRSTTSAGRSRWTGWDLSKSVCDKGMTCIWRPERPQDSPSPSAFSAQGMLRAVALRSVHLDVTTERRRTSRCSHIRACSKSARCNYCFGFEAAPRPRQCSGEGLGAGGTRLSACESMMDAGIEARAQGVGTWPACRMPRVGGLHRMGWWSPGAAWKLEVAWCGVVKEVVVVAVMVVVLCLVWSGVVLEERRGRCPAMLAPFPTSCLVSSRVGWCWGLPPGAPPGAPCA